MNEKSFRISLFFLGTTQKFHNVAANPFIIVGIFYPPNVFEIKITNFYLRSE
jgi:hypothetical protein